MSTHGAGWRSWSSSIRLIAMAVIGVVAAAIAFAFGLWQYAPIIGWIAASLTFTSWVWLAIGRMDATDTATHATREDPAAAISDLLVIIASLASLGAVALVLVAAHSASGAAKGVLGGLAVASVALSWILVHTLFTLRYARLYYRGESGGVGFNQKEPPRYSDFAYLAFTLGMTYQVSDTAIGDHAIRATALRHALLSYLFGAVILATVINLIAGLSG